MRRLLLGIAVAAATLVPGVVTADDTQIADFIQTRLQTEQQSGSPSSGFNVDMQVEQGNRMVSRALFRMLSQELLILQNCSKSRTSRCCPGG